MSDLTPAELAAELHLSPKTLANWRHNGGGPDFVKAGSRVLYPRRAVDRWKTQRTYRRTHEQAAS